MHAAPRRIWRPLRSFLILVGVAGGVLAADKTWFNDLRFEFSASDWWSNITPVEMSSADMAIAPPPADHGAPQLSMSRLLHGLLFQKPSTGWRLEPEKTEFASAWMTQQSGGNFAPTSTRFDYFQPDSFSAGFVTKSAAPAPAPAAPTASGTWSSNASGSWSNSANWSGNVIADGAGNAAHFDTLNITTDVTVTLDTSRSIGTLAIGDTDGTHHYTISPSGGSTLTFDTGSDSSAVLDQVAGSVGDTLSAPIIVKTGLFVNNASSNVLTLSGGISGSTSTTTAFPQVSFNGNITVSGNITNGTATQLSTTVTNGTVIFSGTNSYTGFTSVNGGTLLVNGSNTSAASVQVIGSGTLGGEGTIGGNVSTFGGTITGGTTTTVGTLTLESNLHLATGEGSGTYLANLNGALSDLLAITGTLFLDQESRLQIVGSADGHTTYTLATFGARDGLFDMSMVSGIPTGYELVQNAMDIELVPIPEPSTWIGGAFALGAIGFVARRRTRNAEKLTR